MVMSLQQEAANGYGSLSLCVPWVMLGLFGASVLSSMVLAPISGLKAPESPGCQSVEVQDLNLQLFCIFYVTMF